MATNNTRVAAYLPQDITDALNVFKLERGLIDADTKDEKGLRANDSQALITILAEFLGVSQEVTHPKSLDLLKRIEEIEQKIEAHLVSHSGDLPGKAPLAKSKKTRNQIVGNQLDLDVTDSNSDAPPSKADGQRWLTKKEAYEIVVSLGWDKTPDRLMRWAKEKPTECLSTYGLRRIDAVRGSRAAPAFEDVLWKERGEAKS